MCSWHSFWIVKLVMWLTSLCPPLSPSPQQAQTEWSGSQHHWNKQDKAWNHISRSVCWYTPQSAVWGSVSLWHFTHIAFCFLMPTLKRSDLLYYVCIGQKNDTLTHKHNHGHFSATNKQMNHKIKSDWSITFSHLFNNSSKLELFWTDAFNIYNVQMFVERKRFSGTSRMRRLCLFTSVSL